MLTLKAAAVGTYESTYPVSLAEDRLPSLFFLLVLPNSEDQQKRLDENEAKRDEVAKRLADEWTKLTGEDVPIRNAGDGQGPG